MEIHQCKICCKNFSTGRALGGHMRSHFSILPLPPKKSPSQELHNFQLVGPTQSDSSSTRSQNELHVNTKMGFYDGVESKKFKWFGSSESPTESTQVSSVLDPSQDEEGALCLMMLSRDIWEKDVKIDECTEGVVNDLSTELKSNSNSTSTRLAPKFKSRRALEGHIKGSNKKCFLQENSRSDNVGKKIFECQFCCKVFGSGRAYGGHKRWHLSKLSTNKNINVVNANVSSNVDEIGDSTSFTLDLNLPPPVEDDEIIAVNSILFSLTRAKVE